MDMLIFDCDGVLVDSEHIAEASLVTLLGEWLPDLDADTVLSQALGMTTADILRHLEGISAYSLPVGAVETVDASVEARLAEELNPMPGVADAITAIDLPKVVVSNSRRQRVLTSLATTGLDTRLGSAPVFTAEQVAHPKPDPALYRLAADTLGVSPTRCLVVEDSVSGVTAAHAAGMTVIGFIGASHVRPGQAQRLRQAGACQVIANMQELPALVRKVQQAATSDPSSY